MAYGQKNYGDIQGINGKYRISQIGCFLTSFCNLLERFGMPVDPPTLNNIFIQRGIYIDVDDGIRDDLGWQSVTAYNGQVVTTVKSGNVTERNSIVRLAASNSFGTHFCLVDSIRADGVYIVDSWDGQVKKASVYGPITGWAVYTFNKPQPVGNVSMFNTREEVGEAYLLLRGKRGTAAEENAWIGQPKQRFFQVGKAEADSIRKALSDTQAALASVKAALANEQAKPPKEVVKIVEKIVEKPIEVIKEVPVEADEKTVVEGWLRRQWERLFK